MERSINRDNDDVVDSSCDASALFVEDAITIWISEEKDGEAEVLFMVDDEIMRWLNIIV